MSSNSIEFKYDVAFSFLAGEIGVAFQIRDALKEGYSSFIYTEKSNEVGGSNGIEKFKNVFETEARIVVLLHKENWGKTDWTRVEETGITNRGLKKGWEFLVVIRLDDSELPKWLDKQHIWFSLKTDSLEKIAGVIEYKIKEFGGHVTIETPEQVAEKIKRSIENKSRIQAYLISKEAFEDARSEFEKLYPYFSEKWEILKPILRGKLGQGALVNHGAKVYAAMHGHFLIFQWENHSDRNYRGTKIVAGIREPIPLSTEQQFKLHSTEYLFNMNLAGQKFWQEKEGKQEYSVTEIVDFWLKKLQEMAYKNVQSGIV